MQSESSAATIQATSAPETLRQAYELYKRHKLRGASKSTLAHYEVTQKRIERFLGRPALISDLTDDFVADILQHGRQPRTRSHGRPAFKLEQADVELNLETVGHLELQWAIKAFEAGDMEAFTDSAYSQGNTLAIVIDNYKAIEDRGLLEAALVYGFTGCKHNHSHWSMSFIDSLFRCRDRERLRAVGAPLPGDGPFTIYRGVSGQVGRRKINGLSWTGSLDIACWFARRLMLADPAVYVRTVKPEQVYCYFDERHEQEFIVSQGKPKRLPMPAAEIAERAEAEGMRRKAREAAERETMMAANRAGQTH